MNRPRILVSGGTGFLGDAVVPRLREVADLVLISRSKPGCLNADLTLWDGGIDAEKLKGKFDVFLHMAGLYDLRAPASDAHMHNVVGTHTALALAQKALIPSFIHISTVAVAMGGPPKGLVRTDEIDTHRRFPDAYSETKAQAERMVRSWSNPLPMSRLILRLGVLVGDTRDGHILRIDGPYHAAEGMKRILGLADKIPGPLPLPGHDERLMPIVPVNIAADAIVALLSFSHSQGWTGTRCLHLAPSRGLTARELYESTLRHLGHEGRKFRLLSGVPDWVVKPAAEMIARFPQEELEYLLKFPRFDTTGTEELLGKSWCPEFKDYEHAFWSGYEALVSNR